MALDCTSSACVSTRFRMSQRLEDVGPYHNMEINSPYAHLPQKELSSGSPLSSPLLRRAGLNNFTNSMHIEPMVHDQAFQQQILELKKQQQMQHQILLQRFHAQQQQLAEQHQQQLHQHMKFLEQKKKLEEERERREQEKLEALKKKNKHEQSAVASTEVKQKLQGFLLNKKQREADAAAAAANGGIHPGSGSMRNWSVVQGPRGDSSGGHPYRHPLLAAKYDDDFPLRKTSSEPNLKVRLKQKVIDRHSPMRRKDRILGPWKRKSQLAIDSCGSNPDSGPNSPPTVPGSQPNGGNAAIQEEGNTSVYGPLGTTQGSISDLSLYTSPSMPNISLGRPPVSSSSSDGMKLAPVSEAGPFTTQLGVGQLLPGTLPFYPTLPVIDSDCNSSTSSPAYIHKQMQALEQPRTSNMLSYMYPSPITDTQVAHARLNKAGHRPLGRTQSAPLPLRHPLLQGAPAAALGVAPTHYEDLLTYDPQQTHQYLRQQIRQTVLTRVGSRQASQLDEAPEVEDHHEVIDLTERKGEESEIAKQQREREQFLQQQRDLMMRHTVQINEGPSLVPRPVPAARPLSRALSSPLVALSPAGSPQDTPGLSSPGATALAYDNLMLKHQCTCGNNSSHPEHGGRLQSVWARLLETGLVQRCARVRSRKASLEEIQSCHSEAHTLLFGTNPLNRQKLDPNKLAELPIKSFVRLPCGGIGVDSDTTWNDLHTSSAARMAVGCVVDLALKVGAGEVKNGFAVVRPPGHHAEQSQAMGFCFFNSIAIAARQLRQRLKMEKILIVDWDVHHGNGTQQLFYDDPHVLYISVHRHDDGNFFPGTGGPIECGIEDGVGFNVNVAWSGGLTFPMGDAEYLAAFRTIVMPIAKNFDPEVVLVSAGFDAAAGHPAPLGGYKVSAAGFGHMTQQLMQLAGGKVVLALEGGYDLPSICDAAQECVRVLLGEEPPALRDEELRRPPCQSAVDTLQNTIAIQIPHWPCIKRHAHLLSCSAFEASQKEHEESDTVSAMASLSVHQHSMHATDHSIETSEEPMEQDEEK